MEMHQGGQLQAPFGNNRALPALPGINGGAVTIESERAVAEARGQMQLAKMFPRDLNAAHAELMDACKMAAMAEVAFYSVPQGGQKVTGPSIRLAEQIASCVGNFEFGHRELSRVEANGATFGRSEIEVYAWDKEKNNRSIRQITVLHVLDTKDGPRKLRDQKDIDNKIANVASKQARGRILALMPKWLVEAAISECKKTLAGDNTEPLSVRVRRMTQAFAQFGVTAQHLERYLGHTLDGVLLDELVDLTGTFNAIKEGTPASEFFGEQEKEAAADASGKAIAEAAKKGAATKAAAAKEPAAAAPAATTPAAARAAAKPAAKPAAAPAPAPEPVVEESTNVPEASTIEEDDARDIPENTDIGGSEEGDTF